MINDDGRALLMDFSLITLIPDQSTFLSTCLAGGIVSFMSPEFIDPTRIGLEESRPTKEADCYALGMVIYEVLSGCVPFSGGVSFAVSKILSGVRPEKPQGEAGKLFTVGIWDVVERCWRAEPRERASAQDVLLCLEGDSPNVDGEDDRSDVASADTQRFPDERDAAESNSGRFSSFYPKLPVDHPCDITGSPIVSNESGPLVLPLDSPSVPPSPVVPQDGMHLEEDFPHMDGDKNRSDAISADTQRFSDEPNESGPLVPTLDSPSVPQDGSQPPDPPQPANPEGRISDWLAFVLWYIFSVVIGIFWRARQ